MSLEINHIQKKKKSVKNTNTWKLNNMLLNNQKITEEIKEYTETNDNENTMTQNVCTAKAFLKGKL